MMPIDDLDGDGDEDVAHCASNTGPSNTVYWSRNDTGLWSSSMTWTHVAIATPAAIGRCQGVFPMDLNKDTVPDLVITSDDSVDGASTRSGVAAVLGPDYTTRVEVSGPSVGGGLDDTGDKFDDAVECDPNHDGWPDICTTEQHDGAGAVAFYSPGFCQ
jgi:hypothetical protein